MSLPEPSFIERDAEKTTQELVKAYEQMAGKTLYPAQVERLIIDLIAYREMLLRIGIQEAAKQNLLAYARFPMLDYLGELLGVSRLPAQPARTTLRFTLAQPLSFGFLVPKGTQIETEDGKYIFETIEDKIIPAGRLSVEVQAVCLTPSTGANGYLPGKINKLISVLPHISSAQNISVSCGGSDGEDDKRFRQRIREAPEKFSNAGPYGAYRFWAMSAHQDVVDAGIISPTPGVVNIYPLMRDGSPTQEILSLVAKTLNDERVRPLTDQVVVSAPTKIDYQIIANLTIFSLADSGMVQENATKKIGEYIYIMKQGLGRDIVCSQIIAILNSIYGVYKVDLIKPESDRALVQNEWANCTEYIINIVGSTDG